MKLLRGIKGFSWNGWEKNTFICAVERIINYMEEYITYPYLMGISGAAFRFHIHKRGWHPIAPDATVGFSCGETALQRLGFRYHFLQSIKKTKEFTHHYAEEETIFKQIKDSIDRGFPVLAMKLMKREDWGLVIGYRGSSLISLNYDNEDGNKPKIAENFPLIVCILDDKPGYLNTIRSEIASFETAEELYLGRDFGNFYNGIKGYIYWIKNLRNSNFLTGLKDDKFKEYVRGNYWMYLNLYDAKLSSIKYLRIIEGDFQNKSKYIRELCHLYIEEEKLISEGWSSVPTPSKIKHRKDWQIKKRREQADILERLVEMEEEGIDILKKLNYGVFR